MKQLRHNSSQIRNYQKEVNYGRTIWLPPPVNIDNVKYIDRKEVSVQVLAACNAHLNFRLSGPTGVGKTKLIYHIAKFLKKDLFILNGHEGLDVEDLICTPIMTAQGKVEYVASPLFAAMHRRNSIFFFDEINRANPFALAPLASVLDDRRTLHSASAGIELEADNSVLFCAALNNNEYGIHKLPVFIDERLSPDIGLDYPDKNTLKEILASHLKNINLDWIKIFLQMELNNISQRIAIIWLRQASNLYFIEKENGNPTENEIKKYLLRTSKLLTELREKEISFEEDEKGENGNIIFTNLN